MGTAKLPRGISVRNTNLIIAFSYLGVQCRETLKGRTNNKADIKWAESLRNEIQRKITDNTFKYADYFPRSNKLKIFGSGKTSATFKEYRLKFLELSESRNLKPITLRGYNTCANRMLHFDPLPIDSIQAPQLSEFVTSMVAKKLSRKSIGNTMSVLRNIMTLAVQHGAIPYNVCVAYKYNNLLPKEKIKAQNTDSTHVDPFTPAEMSAILSAAYNYYDELGNMLQFMFYSGLRVSEVFPLQWGDIDFIHNKVSVNKALVDGKLNDTAKTSMGMRDVELEPEALDAIQKQKAHTFMSGGLVFLAPYNQKPWRIDHQLRETYWKYVLKKAGVKYRYPYQTRHTYATMMISKGSNLFWLAGQLGHEDPTMLFRHYGSYLKEHEMSQNAARSFNAKMG